ncbi:MAG: hypothetical protein FGM24_00560 [Candidatus Kapabacteria bacterium]|nr:hypothetical protein [Candidatus Kapabacteria bacterium]
MSFDITLSYDTTYLIPGTLLSNGTLSAQLSWMDGPIMNAVVPGELRIFGASIMTPAKGALPLVAFTADAKRLVCGIETPITLVYPADFNPEFRRSFSTWKADTVRFVARQRDQAGLGISIEQDRVKLDSLGGTVSIPMQITTAPKDNQYYELVVVRGSGSAFGIDSLIVQGIATDMTAATDTIVVSLPGNDSVMTGKIVLRQLANDSTVGTLNMSIRTAACACVRPTKTDAITVETTRAATSNVSDKDIDDDPAIIVANGLLQIQGDHEYPTDVDVYDVYGRMIEHVRFEHPNQMRRLTTLLPGPVILVITTGGRTKREMQWN